MAKPLNKPRWASTVTADPLRYVEPPAGKKDIGWDVGERPPAQYENWLRGTTSDWIDWLDSFESTSHTWTAPQVFSPATADPAVSVGFNLPSATAATQVDAMAFVNGLGGAEGVIDRFGGPSARWVRKDHSWWGRPALGPAAGPADTDAAVDGEVGLWDRHSGPGPAGTPNQFTVKIDNADTGGLPGFTRGFREIRQKSIFQSVPSQYHVIYGDTIAVSQGQDALVAEFSARLALPVAPVDSIAAVGLFQRGSDALPGSGGRDPLTATEHVCVVSGNLYGGKWQIFRRTGGVTTITPTAVDAITETRVRIEIVTGGIFGHVYGPSRINAYLNGALAYTTTTVVGGTGWALGSIHKPVADAGGGTEGVATFLGPVRLQYRSQSL